MKPQDFKSLAYALEEDLVAVRRDFHRHPETAFEEVRTAGIVAGVLADLGMEVQTGVGRTGVVGILEGAHDGPTVLVRADMDALPIREENSVDYVSTTGGKMHACGHDGHTSIALGVARILAGLRDDIHGRVKFVFQPAEEVGRGAQAMVSDGVLEDPRPDYSVGLHLWNSLPVGTVGIAPGPVMAGASTFIIRIQGRGGHAASPHQSIDPVICAAQIVMGLQSIISRNVDPFESGVISVSVVKAGETHNVTPQSAEMIGTMRYFKDDVRDLMVRRMREVTEHTAMAMGCTAELVVTPMTFPVVNDPQVTATLSRKFGDIVGPDQLDAGVRTMGAEDVGLFMRDIPGTYFFVGARDATADAYYPHHHPRFTIDEASLPLGAALLVTAVAAYVIPDDVDA
ncbi:MAG: amidohydrolase [Pleurocapsa minor GSE-CHR-MK-17-07R]|jgi:amidohydrolase|nr:amidohydrolase [Pleurocapsa minor GSE-CHR-MK 17-07R]